MQYNCFLRFLAEPMGSSDRPSKHQAFLALLQEGWTSLHLDARRDGVVVPTHLKGEAHLVLQYGNDLPIPITDLTVDDEGVRATLSFSRTPQQTIVPWSAVYVIATDDGRGVLYNEDIPSDVAVMASKPDAEPMVGGGRGVPAEPDLATSLLLDDSVPEDGAAATSEASETADVPKPPRRTLRSIPLEGGTSQAPSVAEFSPDASLSPAAPAARRRRKPQLRLVK
jgi:stringent starvation protein B